MNVGSMAALRLITATAESTRTRLMRTTVCVARIHSFDARAVVSMLAVSALCNKFRLLPGGGCNKLPLLPGGAKLGKMGFSAVSACRRSFRRGGVDPGTGMRYPHSLNRRGVRVLALMYISGFQAARVLVATACRCPTPRIAPDSARASSGCGSGCGRSPSSA